MGEQADAGFDSSFFRDRRHVFTMGAVATSIAALVAGYLDLSWIYWVILIGASLAMIFMAFPHVWMYVFWFGFVYALAFAGSLLIFVYSEGAFYYTFSGLIVEGAAAYVMMILVNRTKRLRDSADDEYYTPLGIWMLAIVAFFVLANLSIVSWIGWAYRGWTVVPYLAMEVLLVASLIYLMWVPEHFSWGVSGTSIAKAESCPACGSDLDVELRICPECGEAQSARWCPVSEEFVVRCPHCKELTTYGREACPLCGKGLLPAFKCKKCKKSSDLREWKLAE